MLAQTIFFKSFCNHVIKVYQTTVTLLMKTPVVVYPGPSVCALRGSFKRVQHKLVKFMECASHFKFFMHVLSVALQ
jgi:hypothetical protein